MKRFLFFLLVFLLPFALFSDTKPRVAFIPMVNIEDDERYDAVCEAASNTLELTLGLLGKYEIVDFLGVDPYGEMDELSQKATRNQIDNVIFGKAYLDESSHITFEMSVYDTKSDSVTLTKEKTAASLLDIFQTSDEILVDLMEAFSGVHIGFGGVYISQPSGPEGTYSVYVDGVYAGKNLDQIEKILYGSRLIEIRQDRFFGEETIYQIQILLNEGDTYTLTFSIPELLPREEFHLEQLMEQIRENIDSPLGDEELQAAFKEVDELFDDISFNPDLQARKDEFLQLQVEWELVHEVERITSPFTGDPAAVERTLSYLLRKDEFPDPGMIVEQVSENLNVYIDVLRVLGLASIGNENYGEARDYFSRIVRLIDDHRNLPLRLRYSEAKRVLTLLSVPEEDIEIDPTLQLLCNDLASFPEQLAGTPNKIVVLCDAGSVPVTVLGSTANTTTSNLSGGIGLGMRPGLRGSGSTAAPKITPLLVDYTPGRSVSIKVQDDWLGLNTYPISATGGIVLVTLPVNFQSLPQVTGIVAEYGRHGEVELEWEKVPGASDYIVQAAERPDHFENGRYHEFITRRDHIDLDIETMNYAYIRIQPVNYNTVYGRWTEIISVPTP